MDQPKNIIVYEQTIDDEKVGIEKWRKKKSRIDLTEILYIYEDEIDGRLMTVLTTHGGIKIYAAILFDEACAWFPRNEISRELFQPEAN